MWNTFSSLHSRFKIYKENYLATFAKPKKHLKASQQKCLMETGWVCSALLIKRVHKKITPAFTSAVSPWRHFLGNGWLREFGHFPTYQVQRPRRCPSYPWARCHIHATHAASLPSCQCCSSNMEASLDSETKQDNYISLCHNNSDQWASGPHHHPMWGPFLNIGVIQPWSLPTLGSSDLGSEPINLPKGSSYEGIFLHWAELYLIISFRTTKYSMLATERNIKCFCGIMKNIFGLSPRFLAQSSLKPLEFPEW